MVLENMEVVIIATGSIGKEKPANYWCPVIEEKDKLAVLKFMIRLEEKKKSRRN
jgi:hypothetical protein